MKRTMLMTIFLCGCMMALYTAIALAGECNPQRCGTFTPDCDPDIRPCYCFQVAEGGGVCVNDFLCDTHQNCTTSDDCPDGRPCLVNQCCPGTVGKCGPIECTGQTEGASQGVGFGLTAIGKNVQ